MPKCKHDVCRIQIAADILQQVRNPYCITIIVKCSKCNLLFNCLLLIESQSLTPMQISELEKAEVLLSDPGSVGPVLAKLKNLKWLQSTWAGTKTISWIRLVLNVITCYIQLVNLHTYANVFTFVTCRIYRSRCELL